ncbi:MAG: ABC transporter ATP-binding protein [Christensenellaceae bacterium]|nr:ABC transporter ATP-binding protein [Christensenellaceae bacterium]
MMSNKQVNSVKALLYIFKAAPGSFALMALMGLLNGAFSIVSVWATERIFSHIQAGYSSGLFSALAVYAAVFVLSAGYSVWYIRYHVQFYAIMDFEGKIRRMLHGKSRRISNEELETPNAYAFIRQADGSRQHLFRYGQIYVEAAMALVQAVMIASYVSLFHIWFVAFLPLSIVPSLLKLLYNSLLWKRSYETVTQCKREEAEYEKAITDEIACKETRLTGAATLLSEKWRISREKRDAIENRKLKRMFALRLGLSAIECIGSIGGFVVSVFLLFTGKVDLASFTAGVAAYSSLTTILSGFASTVGNETQYRRMIQPFFRYWNMPERGGHVENCSFEQSVTLSDVCFAYPNQTGNALNGINLTLNKGETVAIVGENGAGKSTLVSVILGLYRPQSGRVCYDGIDISTVNESVLHRRQSAVPQNFCRYKMTVGDNIVLGDFTKSDEVDVVKRISSIFPDGGVTRDTLLGKEFGGRELSGGQWQQLSCARGFYKDNDFVVLDEPTCAIDPLREKAIYDQFREELLGKTGIIVTHRLGAVQLADRIIVLQHGQIVESGTHKQLLDAKGLYATFWSAQVEAYNE